MTKYTSKNCNEEKEITRENLIYSEEKKEGVAKEGLCLCGEYMDSKDGKGLKESLAKSTKNEKIYYKMGRNL